MAPQPHVLVVDDDPDIRDLLTILLDDLGRVSTCRDAYEALVRARTEHIDVMVADLVLPGANAVEMLQRMREAGVRVPVVVLTGFPQPTLVDQLRALGVRHVLEKPTGLSSLADVVRELLDDRTAVLPA